MQAFRKKKSTQLQSHLARAIAGDAVPPALVLICGALDPTILARMPGLEVPILLGGMALLSLSIVQAGRETELVVVFSGGPLAVCPKGLALDTSSSTCR
jgi:hypothetical protein